MRKDGVESVQTSMDENGVEYSRIEVVTEGGDQVLITGQEQFGISDRTADHPFGRDAWIGLINRGETGENTVGYRKWNYVNLGGVSGGTSGEGLRYQFDPNIRWTDKSSNSLWPGTYRQYSDYYPHSEDDFCWGVVQFEVPFVVFPGDR